MSEFIHIKEVTIEPKSMTAVVEIADNMPLNTSEDIEATARVYNLLPQITEHACMGEGVDTFRDAMGNTSVAHLLEHVAVELMSQTEPEEDITCGRTWEDEDDDHTFHIQLGCSNDLLGCGALSSAAWIMHWAFADPESAEPNIEGIVQGLISLPEVYEMQKAAQQEEEDALETEAAEEIEAGKVAMEMQDEAEETTDEETEVVEEVDTFIPTEDVPSAIHIEDDFDFGSSDDNQ